MVQARLLVLAELEMGAVVAEVVPQAQVQGLGLGEGKAPVSRWRDTSRGCLLVQTAGSFPVPGGFDSRPRYIGNDRYLEAGRPNFRAFPHRWPSSLNSPCWFASKAVMRYVASRFRTGASRCVLAPRINSVAGHSHILSSGGNGLLCGAVGYSPHWWMMMADKYPIQDKLHIAKRPWNCVGCGGVIDIGDEYRWVYLRPNMERAHPNCAQRLRMDMNRLITSGKVGISWGR